MFTDHKALTFLFTQKHVNLTIEQYIDTLLDYTFSISHCPGIEKVLPDALSRLVTRRDDLPTPQVVFHVRTLRL
jgi:hypothetical protein